jgi:N-acetylated-alpha-linked acidic dipeptidase
VAKKFREAGLDTEIVEYKVWLNYPAEIRVDMTEPPGVEMHGPHREHVDDDPYQDDPRVVTALQRHVALGRCRGGSCLRELRLPG